MPPVKIIVTNRQTKDRVNRVRIGMLAELVMKAEKLEGELYITFIDDAEMTRQNKLLLGRRGATDVIACDLSGGPGPDEIIGELIVSAETAKRASKRLGIGYEDELLRYVAHGILHLSGYDDETDTDRDKMWSRQEELLAGFLGRKG